MAFAIIEVSNGVEIKEVPLGYSWTALFFGWFPSLIRQDWLMFAIMLILSMLTWGLSGIAFSFVYNKIYFRSLLNKGYFITRIPSDITKDQIRRYIGYVKLPEQS